MDLNPNVVSMGICTVDGIHVDFQTHHHPHLDEWLAKIAIERNASAAWVKAHAVRVEGDRYVIELGVGDGPFNEHARPGLRQARQHGETATSLVFKSLGLMEFPLFAGLLKYAVRHDLEGRGTRNDLGNFLKSWTRLRVERKQGAMNNEVGAWVEVAYEALMYVELLRRAKVTFSDKLIEAMRRPYAVRSMVQFIRLHRNDAIARAWRRQVAVVRADARRCFLAARADVAKRARVERIEVGGKSIQVCIYEGDSAFALGAYRSVGGPGGDVFIQLKSTGHILVAATKASELKLDHAVTILRSMIYSHRLKRDQINRRDVPHRYRLRYEGTLPGSPEINFVRGDMRMIMNGALTHPFVPALTGSDGVLTQRQVMYAMFEGLRAELANEALPQKPERREPRGSYAKGID